ncbi:hypothetical protein [Streptomyces canarius]|uniref:Alcohol dehydrogenase-like C-terminal domain-containing protein n=2 Tax=Streptomyces TaxID=1883 RepID=A0ABQ3D2P4_9ACTN|nr:hypothetical protein GCM10010345_70270 [Streptomyces canarius]
MTSVYPAREYGLQVTAADLWVKPDENAVRLAEAGAAGTNDLYLPTPARLLEPGGRIGVVVPSAREEIAGAGPPEHLTAHWDRVPGERVHGRAGTRPGGAADRRPGAPAGVRPGRGTPYLAVRPRRDALRGRTPPAVSPR